MTFLSLRQTPFIFLLIGILLMMNPLVSDWAEEGFHFPASHRGAGEASVLGEFASIFVDYLFLMSEHYWHEGRWYYVPYVYEMILRIQPGFLEAWSLLAWFYAFNSAESLQNPQERFDAITKGIRTLKRGLAYHYGRYDLYFDLAWLYFKRLGQYQTAYQYLEKAFPHEHPVKVERLAALSLYRMGKKEEAESVWTRYLTDHPESEYAKKELGLIRAGRTGKKPPEQSTLSLSTNVNQPYEQGPTHS